VRVDPFRLHPDGSATITTEDGRRVRTQSVIAMCPTCGMSIVVHTCQNEQESEMAEKPMPMPQPMPPYGPMSPGGHPGCGVPCPKC
jgi:hypothetical protein